MRIAHDVLSRFIDLPTEPEAIRELMDDVGLEVKKTLPGTPAVFNLELLANRGDHHCYEGVARELRGRVGGPLRLPEVAGLETGEGYPIEVRTELCGAYSITTLTRTQPESALPQDALRVLEAAENHSISASVDATNVANLELGQPTHAFDADKVKGPIVVRLSEPGEQAWPLFQEGHIEVPAGSIVIADDEKILAIAGVIGCEDSKATAESTTLLLESAAFDPVAVRKASRALSIHTDSSARFERGSDAARVLTGAGRVVTLLEQAGWRRSGVTSLMQSWSDPERRIRVSVARANGFLGVELAGAEMAERLERYGFTCSLDRDTLEVSVPTWRLWDVEFSADLYEELIKSIGYNNTPIALPPVELGSVPTAAEDARTTIDDVLLGQGFYEVITDGFYGRPLLGLLDIDEAHPLFAHVETQNALDRQYSLLKNNALLQAVQLVASNANRQVRDIKAFEWTRTFHPTGKGSAADKVSPAEEKGLMWAICAGDERPDSWRGSAAADTWFLKGVVEEIATARGLELTLGPLAADAPLSIALHPGRSAAILLHGETVGLLGEIHPRLLKQFKIKRLRPCYLEISDALLTATSKPLAYVPPSERHDIHRSLAFTLPSGVSAASIRDRLLEAGPDWLDSVEANDIYLHEIEGQPVRTITYGLVFASADGRTAETVNGEVEAMISALLDTFGERGVALRA